MNINLSCDAQCSRPDAWCGRRSTAGLPHQVIAQLPVAASDEPVARRLDRQSCTPSRAARTRQAGHPTAIGQFH